ncbi:hypothetical protein M422DRAFT_245323 [Sphaerobolus stellatus SS14]|nr:hypothetical protein M422DRAFT_245323 [Sphaerobolus stellatus SS14]
MGRLSGSIISGYLSFYTKDIAASQELPGLPLPFYIMDVSRTALMSSQLTSGIFKPKLHMKTSSLWAERVVKFLEYEHDARGLGELPLEWGKKLQVYLEEKKITGPLQQDIYSCGLHIIWVAQCLISGNNPFEIDELTKDIVQELQETITCRLSQEWTAPKVLPLRAGDSDTSLHAKSIATAPVRTLINYTLPGFSHTVLEIPESRQNKETSPRIEHSPVFYTPSVGSWALWDISSNNVYFPAQIIEVYKSDCIVEIPGGLVLPDGQQKLQPEQHSLSWTQVRSIFEDPAENISAERASLAGN